MIHATFAWASVDVVDGLVGLSPEGSDTFSHVIGYQCKVGSAYPSSDPPTWMRGVMLRGRAPEHTTGTAKRVNWGYYNREAVQALLGFSMAPLCPPDWPDLPPSPAE